MSSEKDEPFDNYLGTVMSNLAKGRVTLKFNNSVLIQKIFFHCISSFILNLYIFFEFITSPRSPTSNCVIKIVYLVRQTKKKCK